VSPSIKIESTATVSNYLSPCVNEALSRLLKRTSNSPDFQFHNLRGRSVIPSGLALEPWKST